MLKSIVFLKKYIYITELVSFGISQLYGYLHGISAGITLVLEIL